MAMHAGSGIRAATLVWMVATLAACGNRGAAPEPPRPVLVAHPVEAGADGMAAVTAYAGEVRAREESALSFRVGGKIARRLVDAGDVVHRGDLLAELDPDDLRLQTDAAQAQLAAAEAQLARARADHARFATLAKQQLVSRSALDQQTAALHAAEGQVRAARAQRDVASNQRGYTELRAPADGAIGQRMAEAGQVLAPGQTVFTFVADGEREVAFALPEANVADFHGGQPVLIELWNDKGARLEGRIREIAPVADPLTRTYAARATLAPGAGPALSIGQSARVYIGGVDTRLSVPLSALQRDDRGRTVVWVADPQARRAHQVVVTVGPYAADSVPVQSGLKAGDWVVVAGGHLLYPDLPVLPVDRGNRPVAAQ
jgi:multidrug efflux system membrane fusion protein